MPEGFVIRRLNGDVLRTKPEGDLRDLRAAVGKELGEFWGFVHFIQDGADEPIEVETVDGSKELDIPAGTQPGTVLTLPNLGIPKLGNPVARGDQRVTVTVDLPKRISDVERELLEQLAGHHSARGKQHHHHNSGLFARLFGQKG